MTNVKRWSTGVHYFQLTTQFHQCTTFRLVARRLLTAADAAVAAIWNNIYCKQTWCHLKKLFYSITMVFTEYSTSAHTVMRNNVTHRKTFTLKMVQYRHWGASC